MQEVFELRPVTLRSELDEQGLQAAALSLRNPPLLVSTDEVTICSPFWPHRPHLGPRGAHFLGLNARELPWRYYDRPAVEWIAENWQRHRHELYRRVGLPFEPGAATTRTGNDGADDHLESGSRHGRHGGLHYRRSDAVGGAGRSYLRDGRRARDVLAVIAPQGRK
jgi:hypothetical protein